MKEHYLKPGMKLLKSTACVWAPSNDAGGKP